jgi:hypothetical protein
MAPNKSEFIKEILDNMKNFRKKLFSIILLILAISALPLVSIADEIKTD